MVDLLSTHIVDLIFIAVIIIFIIHSTGFIESLLELLGFLGSIIISFTAYPLVGTLIMYNFTLPKGIAQALGFFVVWFISESIIYIITYIFLSKIFFTLRTYPLNKALRFIPSIFHATIIYLFFVSLIFSLPVRGSVKEKIFASKTGPAFINASQSLEKHIKTVFGGAISESLNFLTIQPESNESVDLGVKVPLKKLYSDPKSEDEMVKLLNKERAERRLQYLVVDKNLRSVARDYAQEMFMYGFFSHTSKVDGSTALERASREGIFFLVIGENLAFAPDAYLAHQGLMNSDGHRANILSTDYGRVGIGVIDGGIYGRMFVQVFTD